MISCRYSSLRGEKINGLMKKNELLNDALNKTRMVQTQCAASSSSECVLAAAADVVVAAAAAPSLGTDTGDG